ncbi:MAG TPA: Smr/MutS family protein [Phycisphaerae bacterium]|nr:Smr/MutS family protein [Phycisphaerae bacterium]HOJ75526.1 Smr/MutS family protein [Phycisphaerae bacterium]HOM52838.1 Smr/MutS family protein [Phycisphaerae bacterium]HON68600.1 Smr/MutS family protein [Phycisphaerae bacterium]HOQ88474.1 Smr/MutS family protein [Phycisphaerae bacterium]
MAERIRTIILKEGLPTVAVARARLNTELERARGTGIPALKVVHGYGSGGRGGTLREAIRASLRKRRKEGRIRAFVPGEKFDASDPITRQMIEECSDLARDPDFGRYNEGITMVLL